MVPSLGNLDAYVRAVQDIPCWRPTGKGLASPARSTRSASRREAGSVSPALGGFHLAPVRGLRPASGRPDSGRQRGPDETVKRFDPDQGVRLVSYALHWIRPRFTGHPAQLAHGQSGHHQGPAQVVLQPALLEAPISSRPTPTTPIGRSAFSESEIQRVAQELDVRPEDVIEMETRLAGGDVALDALSDDDHEGAMAPWLTWPTIATNPPGSSSRTAAIGWPERHHTGSGSTRCTQPPHRGRTLAEGE